MNSIATFFSSKLESDNPEVQYVKQLTPKVLILFYAEMEVTHD
mgnify:CR=1 FL=1|jgi:hypothetical protein